MAKNISIDSAKEILEKHKDAISGDIMTDIITGIMNGAVESDDSAKFTQEDMDKAVSEAKTGLFSQEQLDTAVNKAKESAIIDAFFSGKDPRETLGMEARKDTGKDGASTNDPDEGKSYTAEELAEMIIGG